MDLYSALLFVHVLSAMGLFGVLAVEAVVFASLRRAGTLDEGRMWMGFLRRTGRLGPMAMVPLLVATDQMAKLATIGVLCVLEHPPPPEYGSNGWDNRPISSLHRGSPGDSFSTGCSMSRDD